MAFVLKLELLLFALLEFALLILVAVGTAMPVMQSYDNSVQFTMWEKRLIQSSQVMRIALSDLEGCDYTTEKLKVMAAFALLSIAAALFGLVFTTLDVLHRPTHKWATESMGLVVWFFSMVVWAVGLGVFNLPMCGGSGFIPSNSQWTLQGAFILFATAWAALTLVLPVMFVIKLYVRPTYWADADQTATAAEVVGEVPVEALRRKKSKRSFIAERRPQEDPVQKYNPS